MMVLQYEYMIEEAIHLITRPSSLRKIRVRIICSFLAMYLAKRIQHRETSILRKSNSNTLLYKSWKRKT